MGVWGHVVGFAGVLGSFVGFWEGVGVTCGVLGLDGALGSHVGF